MNQTQTFASIVDEYDPRKPNSYAEFTQQRTRMELAKKQQEYIERKEKDDKLRREKELENIRSIAKTGQYDNEKVEISEGMAKILPAWVHKKKEAEQKKSNIQEKEEEIDPVQNMLKRMGYNQDNNNNNNNNNNNTITGSSSSSFSNLESNKNTFISNNKDIIMKDDDIPEINMNYGHILGSSNTSDSYISIHDNISDEPTAVLLIKNYFDPEKDQLSIKGDMLRTFSTFGKIKKCIVTELKENVHPEEKSRIFIEFANINDAQHAYSTYNNRYINDNEIHLFYYIDRKFQRLDLKPQFN